MAKLLCLVMQCVRQVPSLLRYVGSQRANPLGMGFCCSNISRSWLHSAHLGPLLLWCCPASYCRHFSWCPEYYLVFVSFSSEQLRLRNLCTLEDTTKLLQKLSEGTLLIGGLDISYSTNDTSLAIAGIAVVRIGSEQNGFRVSVEIK